MIDKAKQYTTRDGRPVRIYATDHAGEYPVHGAIQEDGEWEEASWTLEGNYWTVVRDHNFDLVEARPQHTRWIVVNPAYAYETKDEAIAIAKSFPLPGYAVIQVTWREGDGL